MQTPHSVPGDPAIVAEVTRRLKLLLQAGHRPPHVFLCGAPTGVITWKQPGADGKPIILLFTSFFAARDYIRGTGVSAEVRAMETDALAEKAPTWIQAGADLYGLNRCPRCGVMNALPLETLKDKESFFKFWAKSDSASTSGYRTRLVRKPERHWKRSAITLIVRLPIYTN